MIQFREIDLSEALRMIENDDLDNLYLMFRGRVEPVKEWSIGFCNKKNKTYFKREEVK